MKLHVADVLHILDQKPVMVCTGVIGTEEVVEHRDPRRERFLRNVIPTIHKAQKFIFDSGQDQDDRTVSAVRETAVNMIEADMFHLPHPIMWIEDPFGDDPNSIDRNFYLVTETPENIMVQFFQRFRSGVKGMPTLAVHLHPMLIDLKTPSDLFQTPTATEIDDLNAKVLGEAIYSVKKLLVSLATENIVLERVRRENERTGGDFRRRTYPHSIVRIPLEASGGGAMDGIGGTGAKRRKHLVRGFMWGRNTRPPAEQRWIKPYWRGDNEIGIVERSHYEVR